MELIESNQAEYGTVFPRPYHVFNSAGFNGLNASKCEGVKYLLFRDSKYRLGLIAGIRDGHLVTPYSAPFGGFSFLKEDIRISAIEGAVDLLEEYCISTNLAAMKMALPPLFYNEIFLAKMMNVLYRKQYVAHNLDLDFYIPLNHEGRYKDRLWYNAVKNLQQSLDKRNELYVCSANNDIAVVYELIRTNRAEKGFPMTMQLEDIAKTMTVIPTDLFLVKNNGANIAAAIAFHVNDTTIYIPYWGDINGHGEKKPMNFLSFSLVEHYRKAGKQFLHIGIATENSIPNYGLCEFKESIGCNITPKFTYFKQF